MVETKTCNTCRQDKPITEYYKSSGGRPSREGRCKACRNKRSVEQQKARQYRPKARIAAKVGKLSDLCNW